MWGHPLLSLTCAYTIFGHLASTQVSPTKALDTHRSSRERTKLDSNWKFKRWETNPDGLVYDRRPDLENFTDITALKPWILPSGNNFVEDPSKLQQRPTASGVANTSFAESWFDDANWQAVEVPHDWAIAGPFYAEPDITALVGGGMGRLPVFGVGWYRRKLDIAETDKDKSIFLEIDGAMSYAMVWLNGILVGGWSYPYNSFWLNLTPYVQFGQRNTLAIRLDNPVKSARWYPGGGLYRDVWLTKVPKAHIGQWGVQITSKHIQHDFALIDLAIAVENEMDKRINVATSTTIYELDASGELHSEVISSGNVTTSVAPQEKSLVKQSIRVENPKLWGPYPSQTPNLYIGVTKIFDTTGELIDTTETRFGIRTLNFTGDNGLFVNGERIQIQGVNEHHDLGALGATFNIRAAERKLQILREMGTNAIRMAHNPPAQGLLDLTDRTGFLVIDEIFDSWRRNKTENDFHLIFDDWHEQDLRAMVRRDINHPSIISWSIGNEVVEQSYSDELSEIGRSLHTIIREEDPSRPSTASMNLAQPCNQGAPFLAILDVLSINYQGEGIRDSPNYAVTNGTHTSPAYHLFHEDQPGKLIWTSESASTLSTRGTFFFPVVDDGGAPVNETSGGSEALLQVSAYELYSANFGSSPDKVFSTQDQNTYVGGEFVWTGFDYIGEPTPYYTARSSYSGIIDLAGFKKDRYFLYQARWRPDLPVAHILPHWNWPDRLAEVTPVHLFTNCDEAELFLNGKSMGRQRRAKSIYRMRWDEVVYEPGELHVVSYKKGLPWTNATMRTTGPAAALRLTADRQSILANGSDLVFVTADVVDLTGTIVPTADHEIEFSTSVNGHVVATDNGRPSDMTPFPSATRKAFSGKALAIVRASSNSESVKIAANSNELAGDEVEIRVI